MRRLNVLILLGLAHAASPTHYDFLGNPMPEACADVSDIDTAIVFMPEADMRKITPTDKAVLYGAWLDYVFKPHVILIKEGLSPERQAEVIHHERCHEKMWRLTGNANWH